MRQKHRDSSATRSSVRLALVMLLALGASPIWTTRLPAEQIFHFASLQREPTSPRLRYLGKWTDGTVLRGDAVAPWNDTKSAPQLAGRPLMEKDRSIRWLLEDTLLVEAPPTSWIEFTGGDVMPGRVVGAGTGVESPALRLPAYLEVSPYAPIDWPDGPSRPRIRVHQASVRRIVWQSMTRSYQPRTLFYRDGRQMDFRAVRFTATGIQLLREDGIQEVSLEEAGELHMSPSDSWEAWLDQVATLSPDGAARLLQIETSAGMRLTGSLDRFQAKSRGGQDDPKNWYHLVQPAWSLDAFWVQHCVIRLRRYFAPHEVPLSWVEPSAVRHEADLGGPWPWRADRNVEGGPLVSGGQPYAWGFGVHAAQELEFLLPPMARSFRSRLGLDQIAGEGGCVRARVVLGSSGAKPAYEKPMLIGSAETFDTGRLALDSPGQSPTRLILHVNRVRQGRPPAADPFGIRAHFDWLEPLVELDAEQVAAEAFRRAPPRIPAWQGWKVVSEGREGARLVNHWDEAASRVPVYRLLAASPKSSLTLTNKLRIGPNKDYLTIAVHRPPQATASKIEIRVDGRQIERSGKPLAPLDVPARHAETPPPPLMISLEEFTGREVTVDLVQQSPEEKGLVQWDAITLGANSADPAVKRK